MSRRTLEAVAVGLAVLGLLAGGPARARNASLRGLPVEAVELKLPANVEPALVEKLIEIREGEPFSLAAARRSVERLFQLDLFNEVKILGEERDDGLHLTIVCRPKPRIRAVNIEGNKLFPDAKIQRLLRVTPGDEFVLEEVERRVDSVQLAYRRAGYRYARVLVDPEVDDDEVTVSVRVVEGQPLKVGTLHLTGRLGVDEKALREVMETEVGDVLDLDALDADREALKEYYRSVGRFDAQIGHPGIEIARSRRSADVLLQVDAGPVVDFRFDGCREIAERELREVLHPEREERLTGDVIATMAKSLAEHYERQGYPRAAVESRRTRMGPDHATVVFRIAEGPRVRMTRIEFLGNDSVEDEELRETVEELLDEEVARPLLYQPVDPDAWGAERSSGARYENPFGGHRSQLPGRETYVRSAFERAREALTRLYKMRGFLEVQVGEEELEYSETGERLAVIIPIEEGPRTTVQRVTIEGVRDEFDLEALREVVPLEDGGGLDPWGLEAGRELLRDRCRAEGYYYCAVTVDWQRRHGEGGTTPVTFRVATGPRVRVGRILVRGNIKTREKLVIDRLALRTGDLLLRSALARSRQRLIRTGLFYHATVAPFDPDRPEAEKNLVVQVRERPDSVFEIAGGVSSEKGPSVRVVYEELNLLGRGLRARALARVNYQFVYLFLDVGDESQRAFGDFLDALRWYDLLERDFELGLSYPYLLVFRQFQLGASTDVSVFHRENQPAYGLDQHQMILSLFTDPTERIAGSLQFQLTYDDVVLASDVIGRALPCETDKDLVCPNLPPDGETGAISPNLRVIFDLRDDRFDPMSGLLASASGQYKRNFAGEQVEFLKGEALVTGYIPLHRESRLRLALSARAGVIYNLLSDLRDGKERGKFTPVQDRFFLGGRGDLRSVQEGSLYTQDWPLRNDDGSPQPRPPVSEGGDAYFLIKAELRRALLFGFEAGAFVDVGNLWLYPENFSLNPADMRYSAGLGLRFSTPVGPIAFDYGFNLNRRKSLGEPFGAFHFSIGVF